MNKKNYIIRNEGRTIDKIDIISIITTIGHCSIKVGITNFLFVINIWNGSWRRIRGWYQGVTRCCTNFLARINVQTFVIVTSLSHNKDFNDEIQSIGG
jgi:hypothetical protein